MLVSVNVGLDCGAYSTPDECSPKGWKERVRGVPSTLFSPVSVPKSLENWKGSDTTFPVNISSPGFLEQKGLFHERILNTPRPNGVEKHTAAVREQSAEATYVITWDREDNLLIVEAVGHRRNIYDRHLPL